MTRHLFYRTPIVFLAVLTIGLLAASVPLFAGDDPGSDRIQLLYSSRLSFADDATPEIGIGLMQNKREIRIQSTSGIFVKVYNGPKPQTLSIAGGGVYTVSLSESKPGETTTHLIVETLSQRERDKLAERIAHWKALGIEVTPLRIGAIHSLSGGLINNVRFHLSAASFDNESQARQHADKLKRERDITATLFSQLTRAPSGLMTLTSPQGDTIANASELLEFRGIENQPLTILGCEVGQGFSTHGFQDLAFDGVLYTTFDRNGELALGNLVSMERMLMGIIPAEIFRSAPMEALKAQAIAARGHLLSKLGVRHLADPFHLCATQHCQVYRGLSVHDARTDQAVEATRGLFLVNAHGLVDTTYSASCGGFSENNETAWNQSPDSNLRGRLDAPDDPRFSQGITNANLGAFLDAPPNAYCANAGYNTDKFRWSRQYSAEKLNALVSANHSIGAVRDLVVKKRGVSGRISELEIIGSAGHAVLTSELSIRRLLGGLPSSLVRIRKEKDANGLLARITIDGAGFGHGVGMCQTGAIGRAKAGQDYVHILLHYYSGAALKMLY